MYEIGSSQVFIGHGTENKVDDGSRAFDIGMIHHTGRLKACEHKLFDKFFEWNAILESDRNSDGKTIQHTPHGGSFLCHVDKYFAQRTVGVFACPEKYDLSVDLCFLCKAPSFRWQRPALNDRGQFAF